MLKMWLKNQVQKGALAGEHVRRAIQVIDVVIGVASPKRTSEHEDDRPAYDGREQEGISWEPEPALPVGRLFWHSPKRFWHGPRADDVGAARGLKDLFSPLRGSRSRRAR